MTKPSFTWDVRNCYIPRPGYKLVTIDYNNLELISVATQLQSFYGHSEMLDIINSGTEPTDLHCVFAALLKSKEEKITITYEEFMERKKELEFKAYRAKGKTTSLSRPGGMGNDTSRTQYEQQGIKLDYKEIYVHEIQPDKKGKYKRVTAKLASNIETKLYRLMQKSKPSMNLNTDYLRVKRTGKYTWAIVYDEVVGVRKALDELYPELKDFLTEGHKSFLTGEIGRVKNKYGEWEEEPFYGFDTHGVRREYCTYTSFCNGFLMQTPSAVGAKRAVYNTYRKFESNDDVHPLAFIHDEIVYEIKDNEHLDKNIAIASEVLISSMQQVLTSCRVAVEWAVNDYWSKDGNQREGVYFRDSDSEILRSV